MRECVVMLNWFLSERTHGHACTLLQFNARFKNKKKKEKKKLEYHKLWHYHLY